MLFKRRPRWLYHGFLAIVIIAAYAITVAIGAKHFSSKFHNIDIYDDGEIYEIRTMESNVGNILKKANINITENDFINVKAEENITKDKDEIYIKRAVPVTISVDGKKLEVYTLKDDVAGVLEENNITLSSLDRIKDATLTSEVTRGMEISIVRVTDKIVTEDLSIPFQVIRKENSNMSVGDERIATEGKAGKRVKTYRLLYEDGKEVGKELIRDEVISRPVNKVIEYGTVETFKTSRGSRIQYSKVYNMTATAYTLEGLRNRPKDHPYYGITASGARAQVGIIAVDRNLIPLGTKLYVESLSSSFPDYGFAIAGDVGGFSGKHVDLYYDSLEECFRWGRRKVRVYVLRDQNVDIFQLRKTK